MISLVIGNGVTSRLTNQFRPVLLKVVVDGFNPQANGGGGPVLIEVLETEVGPSGSLKDLLNQVVSGGVVAAPEV